MVASAEFDPIIVEGKVTVQRVEELVTRGRESAKLDYKEFLNPSDTLHKIELVKDLVAMANTAGGYVVVGVADDGTLRGMSATEIGHIDEATIRAQVDAYIGTSLEIFVDCPMVWDGKKFGILTVLRSPRSPIVFEHDGQYKAPTAKKNSTTFRAGDVFVRHGSSSERWNQNDVQTIFARVAERERERWLAEVLPDVRRLLAMAIPGGPIPGVDPHSLMKGDAETLERALRSIGGRLP
jgi:predicted HTH transcriptional regulator